MNRKRAANVNDLKPVPIQLVYIIYGFLNVVRVGARIDSHNSNLVNVPVVIVYKFIMSNKLTQYKLIY